MQVNNLSDFQELFSIASGICFLNDLKIKVYDFPSEMILPGEEIGGFGIYKDNKRVLSVIRHVGSYGHEENLFETWQNEKVEEPIGWQTKESVIKLIDELANNIQE